LLDNATASYLLFNSRLGMETSFVFGEYLTSMSEVFAARGRHTPEYETGKGLRHEDLFLQNAAGADFLLWAISSVAKKATVFVTVNHDKALRRRR